MVRNPKLREAQLRLASIQLWLGQAIEAAWTIKRALQYIPADAEMAGVFLLAVLENGGPQFLLNEAVQVAEKISDTNAHPKLALANALYKVFYGDGENGSAELEALANEANATRDAVLHFAEYLVEQGKVAQARQHLRRLICSASEHPRVLSLLAESYLTAGPFYNPEYAVQLAINGCQRTNWSSTREMHVLAEAYLHSGDKIAALLVASRAKEAGSKLLGTYREEKNLQRLIETLSTGTQA